MEVAIIITGEPLPDIFAWQVLELGLTGKSRQRFLDGCRALCRAGFSSSDFAILVPGWS